MAYNILGINPFHNGSACVLSDGEIVYFLEEERLSKYKHDANPFRVILDILKSYSIDEVVIAGINAEDKVLSYTDEDPFYALIRKFYPKIKFTSFSHNHHSTHLSQTFFNSGFNEALGIVIDGGGSGYGLKGIEMDSIYYCSFNKGFNKIYTNHMNTDNNIDMKRGLNVASAYALITNHLGFKPNEEGKTMGLSSYGKQNPSIPTLFKENITYTEYAYENPFNSNKRITYLNLPIPSPKNNKYLQIEKDLAFQIQKETQQIVGNYIEKYTQKTGLTQVCCSGGYFLNCVANYYLIKRFPNLDFYFEPISHDGGTSIGASKLLWKTKTQDTTIRPQKTLYYGPKYSKNVLLEGIKKYTKNGI